MLTITSIEMVYSYIYIYIYILNNIILTQLSRNYNPDNITYFDHVCMIVFLLNMTVSINKILYTIYKIYTNMWTF